LVCFEGHHEHALDQKGRAFVPKTFLEDLGRSEPSWLRVGPGPDGCLRAYPASSWERIRAVVSRYPEGSTKRRRLERAVVGLSRRIDIDGSGRVLLADDLRRLVDLGERVVFVGMSDHIEIWDAERFAAEAKDIVANLDDLFSEALSEPAGEGHPNGSGGAS
jgi:MraZ protein